MTRHPAAQEMPRHSPTRRARRARLAAMLRDVELVDEDDEDDVVARRVASNLRESLSPERALDLVGVGPFQNRLTALCMLANAADAVEVLSVALVLPTAGVEFHLSDSDKGLLTSAIFAGALVGSVLWGVLGDRVGRRPALAASMAVNALFALLSAASTSFPALVLCRAVAGLGVSGANAVVFTALPEFLPVSHRGFHVVLLASGWMFGSVYSALVGWLVVPALGWRAFLVASAVPSAVCLFLVLTRMPESPRFLATRGRGDEAAATWRRAAEANGRGSLFPADAVVVVDVDVADGRPRGDHRSNSGWDASLRRLARAPLRGRAASLGFVWFALSFGWYGLMLWFPEFFSRRSAGGEEGAPSGDVYAENLMVALANLPGNVASAFAIDRLGRRKTLAGCMAAAAAAAAVAAAAPAAAGSPVAAACAFNALSVGGWNTLDAYSAESFPTTVRSTVMGLLGAAGRLGSLAGTATTGALMHGSETAPLVVAAGAMLVGSAAAMTVPLETAGRALEDACVDADDRADPEGGEELLATSRTRSDERIASASAR